jgi:hypothetical protein
MLPVIPMWPTVETVVSCSEGTEVTDRSNRRLTGEPRYWLLNMHIIPRYGRRGYFPKSEYWELLD